MRRRRSGINKKNISGKFLQNAKNGKTFRIFPVCPGIKAEFMSFCLKKFGL